jgi:hypothetical protein
MRDTRCLLGGYERILYKGRMSYHFEFGSLENIYDVNTTNMFNVFSDGEFLQCELLKERDQEMFIITLNNGHTIKVGKDHLHLIKKECRGAETFNLTTDEIQEGYYLPFSMTKWPGSGSNYDFGYFVGAFAGDGSITDSEVIFTLSVGKKEKTIKKLVKICKKYFGDRYSIIRNEPLIILSVYSRFAVGLIREYVSGKKIDKKYTTRVFDMGESFRRGCLDGHYETDGGNSNRIYTSSIEMMYALNLLSCTLGGVNSIIEDNRQFGRFSKGTNYVVRMYNLSRDYFKDVYFKEDNHVWFKIKKIERKAGQVAYTLRPLDNKQHLLTMANTGILTLI